MIRQLKKVLLPGDLERVAVVRRAGGHGQGGDGDVRGGRAGRGDRGAVDGALARFCRGAVHRDHPGKQAFSIALPSICVACSLAHVRVRGSQSRGIGRCVFVRACLCVRVLFYFLCCCPVSALLLVRVRVVSAVVAFFLLCWGA